MRFSSPLLFVLAFSLSSSTAFAEGRGDRLIYADIGATGEKFLTWRNRIRVITTGDDPIGSVGAELTSDLGEEDLSLIETNASLHGSAPIAALPKTDADLTVVLYDAGSAALLSFSGALGADGSVKLLADATKSPPDIELHSVELFSAVKGFDIGLSFVGVDTYDVAYGVVFLTEGGDKICLATDEKGTCVKWGLSEEVTTRSEVYWNDIGSVWEAEALVAHQGVIELKVTAYDPDGKRLNTAKSKHGSPWLDGGSGVPSLATDEDPLTTMAFHQLPLRRWTHVTVVSKGWAPDGDLPVDAEVELVNGDLVSIPVNSYQRPPAKLDVIGYAFDTRVLSPKARIAVKGDDVALDGLTLDELRQPVCDGPEAGPSACFLLLENEDGEFFLSVTSYSAEASELPAEGSYTVSLVDERGSESWTVDIAFADEVDAVFSNAITFVGDPTGLGLSGRIKLLGEPNTKGKQARLGTGKFYAQLEGDLLMGRDKDVGTSSGEVVVFEAPLLLVGEKGEINAPPVIVYLNGSGTRLPASQVSARPQLF